MYLLVLLLPLLGSLFSGFLGRFLGYYGSSLISCFCITISMVFSLFIFFEVSLMNSVIYFTLQSWFCSGLIEVYWSFLFDSLTTVMLIVVTSISTLVHFYSVSYMFEDPHFPRFLSFLSIFTFFMLLLVTSDNLLQMFFGWEGVGLASYLLINFWFTRLSANQSAIKALIINRIGDFGLLFSIFSIFYIFKSTNYLTIFSITPFFMDYHFFLFNFKFHGLTVIGIFLFIGAVGKSAQLGLHTWLPDAMEGPTPVSALIHAATMVTAGVFLLIRFSPLLEFSSITLLILIIFGSLTAFFGSLTGIFQHDLKKVIAYSTCSQLGYMVFCCGLSFYNLSIFHLFNHAFFKALLFLSAGSIIHAISDEQDMRKMGSLINFLPVTYSLMLVGSLALMGFPFLTGFYSKDVILEVSNVYRNNNLFLSLGTFTCWLGNLAAFFTSFYSFRLIYLTFLNNSNFSRVFIFIIKDSSYLILVPLLLLGIGSLFFGYLGKEFFIGLGSNSFNNSFFVFPNNLYFIESEFLDLFLKWIPFFLSLLGVFISSIINFWFLKSRLNLLLKFKIFFFLINKKWFFDFLFNNFLVFPLLNFGYNVSFKNLDKGFIEIVGPFGLSILISRLSFILSKINTGQLNHYIFYLVISFCLIIFNILVFNFNVFEVIFYFILLFFI